MTVQPSIFADTDSGPTVWIRVEGKGTFQNSPGLKEFSREMMEGGRRSFVVDLANCPAMDTNANQRSMRDRVMLNVERWKAEQEGTNWLRVES